MDEMIEAIVADLELELGDEVGYNEDVLTAKAKNVYREVKQARHYPSTYTDEMIASDMEQFYETVRNVTLFDYNQVGKDFEQSHTENSVTRTFMSRNGLFDVVPIAHM